MADVGFRGVVIVEKMFINWEGYLSITENLNQHLLSIGRFDVSLQKAPVVFRVEVQTFFWGPLVDIGGGLELTTM